MPFQVVLESVRSEYRNPVIGSIVGLAAPVFLQHPDGRLERMTPEFPAYGIPVRSGW